MFEGQTRPRSRTRGVMGDTRHDGQMEINLSIYGAALCLANPAGSAWIDAGRTVDHDMCDLTFFECFLSLSASEIKELARGLCDPCVRRLDESLDPITPMSFLRSVCEALCNQTQSSTDYFFCRRVADQAKM